MGLVQCGGEESTVGRVVSAAGGDDTAEVEAASCVILDDVRLPPVCRGLPGQVNTTKQNLIDFAATPYERRRSHTYMRLSALLLCSVALCPLGFAQQERPSFIRMH